MRTLKILGFLLTYPQPIHKEVLDECIEIMHDEQWLPATEQNGLRDFIVRLKETATLDAQEAYVDLFDRTPSLSLHLFEHIHGDSRERGQAMVDLIQVYADSGLAISNNETPDYLPMFLEYTSTLSGEELQSTLGSIVDILAAIHQRLLQRKSDYAVVFQAILAATRKKPNSKAVKHAVESVSGNSWSFDQLDQAWEEQYAFSKGGIHGQSTPLSQARQQIPVTNIDTKAEE